MQTVTKLNNHLPTEKHDYSVTLGRNEAEHKDVLATAVVALRDSFP